MAVNELRQEIAQAWHEVNCEAAVDGERCKIADRHPYMDDVMLTRIIALVAKVVEKREGRDDPRFIAALFDEPYEEADPEAHLMERG